MPRRRNLNKFFILYFLTQPSQQCGGFSFRRNYDYYIFCLYDIYNAIHWNIFGYRLDGYIMDNETIGSVASKLILQQGGDSHAAHEQMQDQLDEYIPNLIECVENGKKNRFGDFFVEVITKKEKLLSNVLRNYFINRGTCPTPDFDQTVFRYNRADDNVEFLWCVPAPSVCIELMQDIKNTPPEEEELVNTIINFSNGTLLERARKYNKETSDAFIVIEKEN